MIEMKCPALRCRRARSPRQEEHSAGLQEMPHGLSSEPERSAGAGRAARAQGRSRKKRSEPSQAAADRVRRVIRRSYREVLQDQAAAHLRGHGRNRRGGRSWWRPSESGSSPDSR